MIDADPRSSTHVRARRSRKSWRPAAVAAVLVALVTVAVLVTTRAPAPPRVTSYAATFGVPSTYRVAYKVTVVGSRGYVEQVWVRRPFVSVDRDLAEQTAYLERVTRLGELVMKGSSPQAVLVHVPLMPAPTDIRLDAVLLHALRSHRLVARGRAVVDGRRCWIFRSAAPLAAGPLAVVKSSSTFVDSCIDAQGLLLREQTVKGDKVVARREAISVLVDSAAGADRDASMSGVAAPANEGGGAMRAITLSSRPSAGPFWEPTVTPSGFQHWARFAVVPTQPDAYTGPRSPAFGFQPPSLVVSIDDVYVRGADAVVVEQGSTVGGARLNPPTGGEAIEIGGEFGTGQLLLSATSSEVVAEPANGTHFVRVIGTLPPDELVALIRSLRLRPPGTLTPTDAPS